MDVERIGKFMAQLRRDRGLTQEELGEQLGVTNKTISRWETGSYMPPVEALLSLSEFYGLSINELLTGRRLEETEFKTAAEENLTAALSQRAFTVSEQIFRQKWLKERRISLFTETAAIIAALIIGFLMEGRWLILLIFIIAVLENIVRYNRMMSYVEYRVFSPEEE